MKYRVLEILLLKYYRHVSQMFRSEAEFIYLHDDRSLIKWVNLVPECQLLFLEGCEKEHRF